MIRTGILGTSQTAGLYAGILLNSEIFELTGCFSPEFLTPQNLTTSFNIIKYPSIEALFNYTDALIITDFTPDFLHNNQKAIKGFKHILVTNPFLAGLEEIQSLRKLSEESGVLMQIAGGFRFHNIVSQFETRNCLLVELKHVFNHNGNPCSKPYMENLLSDISMAILLLKGVAKKTWINCWDSGLVSVRLELDNGSVANILISQHEEEQPLFKLDIYNSEGKNSFHQEMLHEETPGKQSILNELNHFEKSIRNKYSSTVHNDTMFQALELVHRIKAKTFQNFAVNSQS